MRYLFAVMADRRQPAEATRNEAEAINAFNEKIESSGHRIMAAGVAAPNESMLYDNRHGLKLVRQGPAVDADLFMAGFWIIEAEEASVAAQLAMEASLACNRMIEVRPFL